MAIPAIGNRSGMRIHAIDGDWCYPGAIHENALVVSGKVLPSPLINCAPVGNLTNSPQYGYILDGPYGVADPIQMAINVAYGVATYNAADLPCLVQVGKGLTQCSAYNAIAQGYSTQPSPADLFNEVKNGTPSASAIAAKARLHLMLPRLVAELAGLRPTAFYLNDEEIPTADYCWNVDGPSDGPMWTMYQSLLSDSVMQSRIAALRAMGADTDNHALDALIRKRFYDRAKWLFDLLADVPMFIYFFGRNAVPCYGFQYNGSVASVGIDGIDGGCWAYQDNTSDVESTNLQRDLAFMGRVPHLVVLDCRTGGNGANLTRLTDRLMQCRDNGVTDVALFLNEGNDGAGADLLAAESAIDEGLGTPMYKPRILEVTVNVWGEATVKLATPANFVEDPGNLDLGWVGVPSAHVSGNGTDTHVFTVSGGTYFPNSSIFYCGGDAFESVDGDVPNYETNGFPWTMPDFSPVFNQRSQVLTVTFDTAVVDNNAGADTFAVQVGHSYYSNDGQYPFDGSTSNIAVLRTIKVAVDALNPLTFTMGEASVVRASDNKPNIYMTNYPFTLLGADVVSLPGRIHRTHRIRRMLRI